MLDRKMDGKEPHIVSMMLLSAFAVVGALVMTPSLPQMSIFFGTSVGTTQLVVTLFLLGYSIGQLMYGPLANRFGRKPAFFCGIVIATIGSIFSIMAEPSGSFALLIFGRFLEALGACGGFVLSITVINDFYTPKGVRRVMSWIMLAFSIMPGIAIFLGGFFAEYLGWLYSLYFMLIYGLLLAIPIWRLPETIEQQDPQALHFKTVISRYLNVTRNHKLILFAIVSGLSGACLYVYGAEGPFIGIHLLGIPPALYGSLALLPYLGTLIGSLLGVKLSNVDSNKIFITGAAFELAAGVIMLACFLMGFISMWTLIIPMLLLCFGHAFVVSTAYSLALENVIDKSNGSAMLGFITVAMPVLLTFALSQAHANAAWLLPVLLLVAVVLLIGFFLFARR